MGDGERDLTVGYAPSARATCAFCSKKIDRGELRVTFKTRSDYHDGFDVKWNHALCQLKRTSSTYTPTSLRGIETLRYSDFIQIAELKPTLFPEALAESKEERARFTKSSDKFWEHVEVLEQNVKQAMLKDILVANDFPLEKTDLYDQLFFLALGMYHGLLDPCPACKMHTLVPFRDEARCRGWLSHTKCTYSGKLASFPNRFKMRLGDEAHSNKFLRDWAHPDQALYKTFKEMASGGEGASADADADAGASGEAAPEEKVEYVLPEAGKECQGMVVYFAGEGIPKEVKALVSDHGGEVQRSMSKFVTHVIVAPDAPESKGIKDAVAKGLPVVPLKFLYELVGETPEERPTPGSDAMDTDEPKAAAGQAAEEGAAQTESKPDEAQPAPRRSGRGKAAAAAAAPEPPKGKAKGKAKKEEEPAVVMAKSPPNVQLRLPEVLKESGLLLFGSEPGLPHLQISRKRKSEESGEGEGEPSSKRLKLPPKPGSELLKVDPESGKAGGKILVSDDGLDAYNCMMNNVDLVSGKNRFYNIQIIEMGKSYFFFKKWGRTGGEFGGSKVERFGSKVQAIQAFEEKFFECTGNNWEDKDNFRKKPTRYSIVHLDDGNDSIEEPKPKEGESSGAGAGGPEPSSKLNPRLLPLMNLLFNAKEMEKAMQQMNIDTKKMPLGKLTKSSIIKALAVLKQIDELLADQTVAAQLREMNLLNLSTEFYSLIPHYFASGMAPPVIKNQEMIREKTDMLSSLADMEIAGKIMSTKPTTDDTGAAQNEMDSRYRSLDTELTPLDHSSEDFINIKKFTQSSDHKIEVYEVFEVKRKGEHERFEPWVNNPNRQLLWHGSRLTNWVGILSQGLRIAPPEAPVSGYLFGKGVYFANMIEKSAHYCRADRQNPHCLLSLSEVALGKMYEVTRPEYMEKSKPGFESTKALGRRYPDPKGDVQIGGPNGPVAPLGKALANKNTTMGYDEFIVYDVSQIRCRYLIQGKFIY